MLSFLSFICKWCAAAADLAPSTMATAEVRQAVEAYRQSLQDKCPGGTWCDCQHRVAK